MDKFEGITVSAPLFLIATTQTCNLCGKDNRVVALATKSIDTGEEEDDDVDGYLLSYVEEYPDEILQEVLRRHSNFGIHDSATMGESYYMTVCECGGHYGDHYVHKQILDQAFRNPQELTIKKLPVEGEWVIECGFSQSLPIADLIDRAMEA